MLNNNLVCMFVRVCDVWLSGREEGGRGRGEKSFFLDEGSPKSFRGNYEVDIPASVAGSRTSR